MSATGPGFAAEDLSLFARIQRVFYAPRTAFAAVRGQESAHDWLLPILLVCAVGVGSYNLTLDLRASAVQEQLGSLDEAEWQQAEALQALQAYGWMEGPMSRFFSLVVVGGVLLMLARSAFQAEVSYRQMLVVKAYAMLVVAVELTMWTVLVLATGDIRAHLGLGLFLSEEAAATFGGRILAALNPFDLWQIGIMGVGLSVLADAPVRKATVSLGLLWLLWIFGGVFIETIGQSVPPPPPE
ncbi:MAG: YIP1 family protein [Gemmatimonadota bacterium]|nr:YIP1 family protein [Gemmatimonadota bacterium]